MKKIIVVLSLFIIAFSCKKEEELTPYQLADGTRGGSLYNTFWDPKTGFDQSNLNLAKFKASPDFFKCKQCHGWDREGSAASYISRAPNANRPRVSIPINDIVKTYTPEKLFEAIKTGSVPRRSINANLSTYNPTSNFAEGDKMPNYSEILTDAQIWDIVKFFKEEAFNVKDLYDYATTGTYPTGKIIYSNIGKNGNASRGKTLFESEGCATSSCHGSKGNAIKVDNATYTVGSFLRAKPNEAQHKIRFGQNENSGMFARKLSLQQMQDIYAALSDTLAFPN
jgi:mono/diheme cytochrome c family protein